MERPPLNEVEFSVLLWGNLMKGLRQLFAKIIASNPDCPKNVVIGSLHWKRLVSPTEVDDSKQQHSGEGNSKRAFTLYAFTDDMELFELVTMSGKTAGPENTGRTTDDSEYDSSEHTHIKCDGIKRDIIKLDGIKREDIKLDGIKHTSIKSHGVNSLQYSKPDVLAFVQAVNDENPIHRTAHPIVPGCLLLEGIIHRLQEQNQNPTDIYMRFKLPVYGGDVVELVEESKGRYKLHGLVQGRTVFVVKWQ